jgi:hypothetical protein
MSNSSYIIAKEKGRQGMQMVKKWQSPNKIGNRYFLRIISNPKSAIPVVINMTVHATPSIIAT